MKKIISILLLISTLILNSQTGVNKPGWLLTGNAAVTGNFLGTTNATDLNLKTNNVTRLIIDATGNVYSMGHSNVVSNTAYGNTALISNTTTGTNNSAFGFESMYTNTTGSSNSSFGSDALVFNLSGSQNSAFGNAALYNNTTASNNTAFGYNAAFTNSTGIGNVAVGSQALLNSTVSANTAIGRSSLSGATSGASNTAIGFQSGINTTTGNFNIWIGYQAGLGVTTGSANTFIGNQIASQTSTTNNNIILADGAGNIKYRWDGTNNTITGPLISGAITTTNITSTGALVFNAPTGNPIDLKINNSTVLDIVSTGVTITGSFVSSSNIWSTSKTAGIGYAVGSGSTVTQATSRTTGVTINSITGNITLLTAVGLATYQSFTMTNSTISANDVVIVEQKTGTDLYIIMVTAIASGSCRISFATTGGTTSEAPVFNFSVIKGQIN